MIRGGFVGLRLVDFGWRVCDNRGCALISCSSLSGRFVGFGMLLRLGIWFWLVCGCIGILPREDASLCETCRSVPEDSDSYS